MGVFENLVTINEFGDVVSNEWIEWSHFLIPNKPEWFRKLLQTLVAFLNHCRICTTFYSGWIVCLEGKIKNTTPFGGWVK